MRELTSKIRRMLILCISLFIIISSGSLAYGNWLYVTPPSVSSNWYLNGVHFTSANEGWAVGTDQANLKGVLLHYVNGSWTSVPPPSVSSNWYLNGVHFTSANEGWAVGADQANLKGVLLHYVNGSWTSVPPPSVSSNWYLNGVHFTSANEGWAVGAIGVMLHYTNGSWNAVDAGTVDDLYSVYFTSPSEGWAVGNCGIMLYYANGFWSEFGESSCPLPQRRYTPINVLYSVYFTSASEGWAVGFNSGYDWAAGTVSHFLNGSWTSGDVSRSSPQWLLNGVYFASATEGWIIGYDSYFTVSIIFHYVNGIWTADSVMSPSQGSYDTRLNGIHFTSATEGWIVGQDISSDAVKGFLLHFTASPPPSNTTSDTTPPITTARPVSGTYFSSQRVTLTCNDGTGSGCKATYYCFGLSLDCLNPISLYKLYIGPLNISESKVLSFYSIDNANNEEGANTETYTIDTSPPSTTASPPGGQYHLAQNVVLICNDYLGGAGCQTTYYCLGSGCTPTTIFSGSIYVASSTDLRFYSIDNVGNVEAIKVATYTITPPPVTHTITASAGPNGSISPSGTVTLNDGANGTFNITPNANYQVADVLVDGSSVGAVTSYTFNNVTANHTITASFLLKTILHTITASAGANGSISPSGAITVNDGSNQSFTITANATYQVADVLVDGSSVGAVTSYTFNNVTANHTITASFLLKTYRISGYVKTNGIGVPGIDITGLPGNPVTDNNGFYSATVNYGWNGTVTPTKYGYAFTPSSMPYSNVTGDYNNQDYAAQFVVPRIDLGSGSDRRGGTVVIPIILTNIENIQISAISVDIGYDSTVLINPSAILGPAGTDANKEIVANVVSPGIFRLSILSASNNIAINNGIIAYVRFDININAPIGTATLTNTPSASDPLGNNIGVMGSNGTILVNAYALGDCDQNGDVDIAEVQSAINMFLGIIPVTPCVDVNGDGRVTIGEVVKVINNHLGIIETQALSAMKNESRKIIKRGISKVTKVTDNDEMTADGVPSLTLGTATASSGQTVSIPINLQNVAGYEISAISTDISYDTTVLENPTVDLGPAASKAGKTVVFNEVSQGVLRIGILSLTNSSIISDGVIANVSFSIKADAAVGNSVLEISSSGADPFGNEMPVESINGMISVIPPVNLNYYALTVNKTGTGNGLITSSPKGINCGSDCRETFPKSAKPKKVTLTVKPTANSTFLGWGGDCQSSGTKTSCTLTMASDKNVTSSFGSPDIAVSPDSYDFGNVAVKQSSSPVTFTIRNNGTGNLKVKNMKIVGTNANMFKIKGSCNKTISSGGSCQFTVTLKPTSIGSKTATLQIISNDPDMSTIGIPLSGAGM